MARFGQVLTAMVTPFRQDGSVNVDEAQKLAKHLLGHGSDGVVVAGSTGESATMTHDEKILLYRAVKDAVGSNGTVIAGTGTYSTADSIDLTEQAEKAGCDGVLIVTPYYNRPPQRALADHFRAIADATSLPVMLYNVPSRTATKIEIDTLLRAAESPNIVALKESGYDLSELSQMMSAVPDGFEVYSGNDDWTLPMLVLGAVGVVSVDAHVIGETIAAMFAAFEKGDLPEARRLNDTILRVHKAMFCTTNPIPVKAAVNLLGFDAGAPRGPLAAATEQELATIKSALESAGVL